MKNAKNKNKIVISSLIKQYENKTTPTSNCIIVAV
jgi:hypothetical protein